MNYTSLLEEEDKHLKRKEEFPKVSQINLPTFTQSLKTDIGFNLIAGVIFGVGHFFGLWLIKKALK